MKIQFVVMLLSVLMNGCFATQSKTAKVGESQKTSAAFNDPAFKEWERNTASLPIEKQLEAVATKLKELNPGFDGKLYDADGKGSPDVVLGNVWAISFDTDDVVDISPVRALTGLGIIRLGNAGGKSKLSDLSPLQGMKLITLNVDETMVSDLAPLEGMPLENLMFSNTKVTDLSPLRGMPLKTINFDHTEVSDLSPLKKMPLEVLIGRHSRVTDVSPLATCPKLLVVWVRYNKIDPASVAAVKKTKKRMTLDWDEPVETKAGAGAK
jgi:Leucine-rich repeat (LRR) protein